MTVFVHSDKVEISMGIISDIFIAQMQDISVMTKLYIHSIFQLSIITSQAWYK